MSKKKKILIIMAILSCIILAILGGQSFSKYISEIKGNGSADIAQWNFQVNNEKEEIQTIELKSKYDNEIIAQNKIAPGTEGSFDININASQSDVGIDYNIKFTDETAKPTNLKFIYEGQQYDNITALSDNLSGRFDANAEEKQKTFTIKWVWPYETGANDIEKAKNNKIDTDEAQEIANYSFKVIVSGTQVPTQT